MAEPRVSNGGGRSRVQRMRNVDFVPAVVNPSTGAAVAYRAVPNGQRTRVRTNRTQEETLEQMRRMYERYGDNSRAARAYARTVNAMTARGRWGKL